MEAVERDPEQTKAHIGYQPGYADFKSDPAGEVDVAPQGSQEEH